MTITDPYAGIETDEERQVVYQNLLKQYERDSAEYQKTEFERQKSIREFFTKDSESYRNVQLHEDKEFNKYVSMFAAGSFGVSFAFMNNIVPFNEAAHRHVLIAAWALLAAALVISVLIHRISAVIHGKYYEAINNNIRRGYEGKPPLGYKRWYSLWVMAALYWLDFIAFLGGMACLIAFVFLNAK
jgi:ABC-type Fe3+-siderophore transport system permease subunit